MLFFLELVAAVLVALLLLALIAWTVFKRWLKRKVGGYQAAAEILGEDFAPAARLQLAPAPPDEDESPGEAFALRWEQLRGLGFQALGDLADQRGAFARLRLGLHSGSAIAAALVDLHGSAPCTLFALTQGNRFHAFGDGDEPGCSLPSLHWESEPGCAPALALERLQQALATQSLRALDLRVARAAFEAAWATRADTRLAQAPQRADIEALARQRRPSATREEVDRALEFARAGWLSQVQEALLDRYRRASRVDAVTWERIGGTLHAVHAGMSADEIIALLPLDEAGQGWARAQAAAGARGSELYERLQARLPAAQRRHRLAEVDRPLPAVLYLPSEEAAPVAAPVRPHLYVARDADGREVHGTVQAVGSSDALRQIGAQGLEQPRLLSEPLGNDVGANQPLDPELALVAARAVQESVWLSMLRVLWANALLWAPPALLLGWSLYEGPPYGVGDWTVFAYAALALAAMLVLVGPMFFYNQLLQARTVGSWGAARRWLWLLRRTALLGAPSRSQLCAEECKILAGSGDPGRALALWESTRDTQTPEQYWGGLIAIHDAAHEHPKMIAAQREFLRVAGARELATIDLALALARYQRAIGEAEDLLAKIPVDGLSELALAGHHMARGLIHAERGMHALAGRQFEAAIAHAGIFRSNPLTLGMLAELHGLLAWTLRRGGQAERAAELWRKVGPVLEGRAGSRDIVARWNSA